MSNTILGSTFVSMDGLFIHVSQIKQLSRKPFKTEEGVMTVLGASYDSEPHVYALLHDKSVEVLSVTDPFNARTVGVDLTGYVNYNSEPNEQKVERLIVKSWAFKEYPEHELHIREYNSQDSGVARY